MSSKFTSEDVNMPLAGIERRDHDRLTFGVEFEFALATLPTGVPDPHLTDGREVYDIAGDQPYTYASMDALRHIAKTLSDAGIRAKSVEEMSQTSGTPDETVWVVDEDVSIITDDLDPSYAWHSVEIQTPPYYFSTEAIDTIKKVCEVISTTYRVACTKHCGLHVHVGNSKKGHTFETLRNLFATLWTFEPQLASIHPSHRTRDNNYCCNLRDTSILALDETPQNARMAKAGLDLLLHHTPTPEVLNERVSMKYDWVRCGYDTLNIWQGYYKFFQPLKKTVEFRQHEATLDPEGVANWARLCVGLLEFADTVEAGKLERFLEAHIDDEAGVFGIGEVLRAIGMPHLAGHFGRVVHEKAE